MFREYDVVRLTTERFSPTIPVGTIGTVLIVYDAEPPVYEVEFGVEPDGRSLGTKTVKEEDIEAWRDS